MNSGNINDNLKKRIQNGVNQQLRNDREQNNEKKMGKKSKDKLENKQGKGMIKI